MSFHIVEIGSSPAKLTCRDNLLLCETTDSIKTLPLEDICSIVVTSFDAVFSSSLLVQACRTKTPLILCHNYKPVSVVLPANRSTDTILSRAQYSLKDAERRALWAATVDAKCANQADLALKIGAPQSSISKLLSAAAGRKPFKEAACARLFWGAFSRSMGSPHFRRDPRSGGLNSLLNFGYAVLLSVVLRKLLAVGIDPTWGIAHKTRERATPLAYDLMEPFRPAVDARVWQWVRERAADLQVTSEFKSFMGKLYTGKIAYRRCRLSLAGAVEMVVRSFRRAVLTRRPSIYRPWISTNTKWDG
jgi:CRISPR-associated protein Cas1